MVKCLFVEYRLKKRVIGVMLVDYDYTLCTHRQRPQPRHICMYVSFATRCRCHANNTFISLLPNTSRLTIPHRTLITRSQKRYMLPDARDTVETLTQIVVSPTFTSPSVLVFNNRTYVLHS